MHGLAVYLKEKFLYAQDLSLEHSVESFYFTESLTSFFSIDHLCLYAQFLILFHLT